MKPNMGTIDRTIRAIAGIAALVAWSLGLVEGTLGIIVLVVGVVMIATAALRWCPPYALIGLNTGASKD
jgi:Inner membrane protein YgaP-like, transmembrane domain